MDPFSYLSVLISIILGLGIAQLLTGFGKLVQDRGRVVVYWPSMVWAGLVLMMQVHRWWLMFGQLRGNQDLNFFVFLLVLMPPIMLYLLAALVFPDFAAKGTVDMRENYYSQTAWFFGIELALLAVCSLEDAVLTGALSGWLDLGANVFLAAGCVVAMLTRRENYHKAFAVLAVIGTITYNALLFPRLQ